MSDETDILADWKRNKFILIDPSLTNTDNHVVVLTDIQYWAEHQGDLVEWCNNTAGVYPQGMTVEISDEKTLTHFVLRWS